MSKKRRDNSMGLFGIYCEVQKAKSLCRNIVEDDFTSTQEDLRFGRLTALVAHYPDIVNKLYILLDLIDDICYMIDAERTERRNADKNSVDESMEFNIRSLRFSANMTQEEVADALGVQRTTVTMWETGKSVPRTELLPRLAELFGCTVDELFRDDK